MYKYLIGRSGQSVDSEVYSRCIAQRIEMFVRMIRKAADADISDSDRYRLSFVAEFGIMAIYRKAFCQPSAKSVNDALRAVDDMVLGMGEDVYQHLGNVPLSPYIRLKVVRTWRRRHYFSSGMICFVRFMLYLESVSGSPRRLIRKIVSYIK